MHRKFPDRIYYDVSYTYKTVGHQMLMREHRTNLLFMLWASDVTDFQVCDYLYLEETKKVSFHKTTKLNSLIIHEM